MKKVVRVFLAVLLPWSIIVGTGESVVVAASQEIVSQESSNEAEETLPDPIDENLNEEALTAFVSEQIDDGTEIEFTEEGVYINGNFYNPEEFDYLLESMEEPTDLNIGILDDSTSNSRQKQSIFYSSCRMGFGLGIWGSRSWSNCCRSDCCCRCDCWNIHFRESHYKKWKLGL